MRILTLDDAEERQHVFARWFVEHDHFVTFTAHAAIDLLDKMPRFDLVHLDHDLAEEHYLTLSEGLSEDALIPKLREKISCMVGTGMDVVDHIVGMPEERRPQVVVVHSYNIVRAPEMLLRLQDAGVRSCWIKFSAAEDTLDLLTRIGALRQEDRVGKT
jgi:CheY-like chemotaxis protein